MLTTAQPGASGKPVVMPYSKNSKLCPLVPLLCGPPGASEHWGTISTAQGISNILKNVIQLLKNIIYAYLSLNVKFIMEYTQVCIMESEA